MTAVKGDLAKTLPAIDVVVGLDVHDSFALLPTPPLPDMMYAIDLQPALRATNFDHGALLPGLWPSGCLVPGHCAVHSMPTAVAPLVVRYLPAAFDAAGVAAPAADWTIEDFEATCGAL